MLDCTRFHNFMAYDRHWLDEEGGENTQARAVRSLVAATHGLQGALGSTASELLSQSWPALYGLNSPRAQAIALIALAERAEHEGPEPAWVAKLPHGLIAYGRAFKRPGALATGLKALRWLELQQTAPDGAFLPVGSERLYRMGEARPLWDGQPIEVYATVAASLEAHRAVGDATWLAAARRDLGGLLGPHPTQGERR